MPRSLWKGSISFGLVNVPIRLFTAEQSKDVHFNQLQESTGARIRYKKVSEKTGREVDSDEIVSAYELDDGGYVTLTSEELGAVQPERTHSIDIEDFVELGEIDPVHFQTSYWISPEDNAGAKKAYALLRDAMARSGRVAIGRFVLRTKPHLVAIRATDGALVLHTMLFPDEVVAAKDVTGLPVKVKADKREVDAAMRLVDSLTVEWDPKRYRDDYRETLLDMIETKAKGEEIVVPEEPERKAEVVDLMAALEASLAERKQRGGGRSSGSASTSSRSSKAKKTAPKKKAAAKKKTAARKSA